jgi:hypothetical protein
LISGGAFTSFSSALINAVQVATAGLLILGNKVLQNLQASRERQCM